MKRLTFYNHYGVGDLFESREFVLDWMRLYGVPTAEYACRYPAVFEDLPQIQTCEVRPDMDMRRAVTRTGEHLEHLMVNTWIGARNGTTQPPGDYVLWPGVGCTVENLYRMHNDYLREAGLTPLGLGVLDYLPTIDYTRVNLGNASGFLEGIGMQFGHTDTRLVLVCNGATGSGHAANFDFGQMVERVPVKVFVPWEFSPVPPVTLFLFTERYPTARRDVFFTDDITWRQPGQSDMLAISYLSRFCSVIVGRCSGAQMPCETRENWMDEGKTLLSFTQHRNGACFVRNPEALGLKMRLVWSGAETPEEGAKVLEEILE